MRIDSTEAVRAIDGSGKSRAHELALHTRRLVAAGMAGAWESAFKGRGSETLSVRPYDARTDAGSIDWRLSAGTGVLTVRETRAMRQFEVVLLVDFTQCSGADPEALRRRDTTAELCALLTETANANEHPVSLIVFSDVLEVALEHGTGPRNLVDAINLLLEVSPKNSEATPNWKLAAKAIAHTFSPGALVFVVSSFSDLTFKPSLARLTDQHDLIAVAIADPSSTRDNTDSLVGRSMDLAEPPARRGEPYRSYIDARGAAWHINYSGPRDQEILASEAQHRAARDRGFRSIRMDRMELSSSMPVARSVASFLARRARSAE